MDKISQLVNDIAPFTTKLRRDLHKYPETAWLEFRTASLAAKHLADLGCALTTGVNAQKFEDDQIGRPEASVIEKAVAKALRENADLFFLRQMKDGGTGFWADIHGRGGAFGPLLALRFDMDANNIEESSDLAHRPVMEGFASVHNGVMHACGHDGHTAVGLALAEVLTALRDNFSGTVRLIFQPAEEGGLGALPMLRAGALNGVNCLIGLHFGINAAELGQVICGSTRFLATSKFDAVFEGRSAHAGLAPQDGCNALLAACHAVTAMHAAPRHSGGASRICVGVMRGGQARNVIPDRAEIYGETRGLTGEVNSFIYNEAMRMAEGAARMWNCCFTMRETGHCPSADSSPSLAEEIASVAGGMPVFHSVKALGEFGASEDFTWFMNSVRLAGGEASHIQLGAGQVAGHHNRAFDFDEKALEVGIELLARIVMRKLGHEIF